MPRWQAWTEGAARSLGGMMANDRNTAETASRGEQATNMVAEAEHAASFCRASCHGAEPRTDERSSLVEFSEYYSIPPLNGQKTGNPTVNGSSRAGTCAPDSAGLRDRRRTHGCARDRGGASGALTPTRPGISLPSALYDSDRAEASCSVRRGRGNQRSPPKARRPLGGESEWCCVRR